MQKLLILGCLVFVSSCAKIGPSGIKPDVVRVAMKQSCEPIYGHNSDNISNELVESKLFELIEKDPRKFFLLWIDNKNKDTQYILETAISKNVIRKSKNVYYYGTDVIGRSQDDAISFLNEKANQDIKMAIMQEIESK